MGGHTILIVEPNPGILIVARNTLARVGFTVVTAGDAGEAIEAARHARCDLVLVDAHGADPEELFCLARSRSPAIPLILTAPRGSEAATLDALADSGWLNHVEVAGVLDKPFSAERLLGAVERALSGPGERTDPLVRIDYAALLGASGERAPFDLDISVELEPDLEDEREAAAAPSDHAWAAPFEPDAELTDRFQPFRGLLELDPEDRERTETCEAIVAPVRRALSYERHAALVEQLRIALAEEGADVGTSALAAMVRACEAVILDAEPSPDHAFGDPGGFDDPGSFDGLGDFHGFDVPAAAGDLRHLRLDAVLQLAGSLHAPTRVRLDHEGQVVEVFVHGHEVLFARQERLPDGFMLGRFLVSLGAVRPGDIERACDPAFGEVGGRGWLGQRLLALGVIREDQLRAALHRQTEELVYEAVRWTSGRFAIYAFEPLPPEVEEAQVAWPIQHLLLEGMRRLDGLRSIVGRLDPTPAPDLLDSLAPEERMLLEQADGRRTVEEIIGSLPCATYAAAKALDHLRDRRLVTVVAPAVSA